MSDIDRIGKWNLENIDEGAYLKERMGNVPWLVSN